MRRKWVILVALVFIGAVWRVVVNSPKVYSHDEVRATFEDLDSGWIMESQSTGFHGPGRNILREVVYRIQGIRHSAGNGADVYGLRNGEERISCLIYYDGKNVEEILLSSSEGSRDLMQQIQRKLPRLPCRIDSHY